MSPEHKPDIDSLDNMLYGSRPRQSTPEQLIDTHVVVLGHEDFNEEVWRTVNDILLSMDVSFTLMPTFWTYLEKKADESDDDVAAFLTNVVCVLQFAVAAEAVVFLPGWHKSTLCIAARTVLSGINRSKVLDFSDYASDDGVTKAAQDVEMDDAMHHVLLDLLNASLGADVTPTIHAVVEKGICECSCQPKHESVNVAIPRIS
jgi:hypothetical protein